MNPEVECEADGRCRLRVELFHATLLAYVGQGQPMQALFALVARPPLVPFLDRPRPVGFDVFHDAVANRVYLILRSKREHSAYLQRRVVVQSLKLERSALP